MHTGGLSPAAPDLFTVGYEGLLQPQLLVILAAAGVRTVLDVRAVPLSRKAGFSKSVLSASLQAHGIDYAHERRLGTPKPGRVAARRGAVQAMHAIFDDHMRTADALAGLDTATLLARAAPTCLLCFEREPHQCHRAIVARMIRERTGQAIRHL